MSECNHVWIEDGALPMHYCRDCDALARPRYADFQRVQLGPDGRFICELKGEVWKEVQKSKNKSTFVNAYWIGWCVGVTVGVGGTLAFLWMI